MSDVVRRSELGGASRGIFVDGAVEPVAGEDAHDHEPGDGGDRRPGHERRRRRRRPRRPLGPRRAGRLGAARLRRPRRRAPRGRRGAPRARRGADPGLVAEQGKTVREARIELRKAADTLEHYAGLAKEVRAAYVHGLDPGVDGRVLRKPLGVVAAIVPWNFPTTLLSNKLGPALVVRQHGRRQAGRHDAVHDPAARRDPHGGGAAAGRAQRRHRHAGRRWARRSSRTRSRARSRSPARPRRASASWRSRRRGPSA